MVMARKSINIGGKHFNKEELYEKVDSDPEIIEMLFDSVKGQVPGYIGNIESIVESLKSTHELSQEQIDLLKFSSHSIKGSAYNLCVARLGNSAKHIEMTSREWGCPEAGSKGEMLPHLFKLLKEEWSLVLSLMKI